MVMLNQRHIYLNKYNIRKMYTGTFVVAGAHTLQVRALRGYLPNILEYFVSYVICDLYLQVGRSFMKEQKSLTDEMSNKPVGPSVVEYLKGFLILMMQLIVGGCITATALVISWGCDKLADMCKGSPYSSVACRIIGICILGAGVVSIVVFTYITTRSFLRSMLRKNN